MWVTSYGKDRITQGVKPNAGKGRFYSWGKQLLGSRSEPLLRDQQDVPSWISELSLNSDGCVPPIPPPLFIFLNRNVCNCYPMPDPIACCVYGRKVIGIF